VGRRAEAATDGELRAEIYSYSRSRGLFAGVSLEGSVLQVDDAANAAYYGAAAPGGTTIPGGTAPAVPQSAIKLVEIVAGMSTGNRGPALVAPNPSAAPAAIPSGAHPETHLDAVQTELAKAATSLNPLLDDAWRRYLAMPAEVYQPGRRPPAEALNATLQRFNAVARNRQYQSLSSRPEFHTTHHLLQALYEDVTAAGHQLSLPPPPTGQPR
jgi:hypothetical protein